MRKQFHELIDLFIEKTNWANGITIAITIVGLIVLATMKRDLHPPFKFNYVEVSIGYPNASADEVERLITYPLEEKLRDVSDLQEISSNSKTGQSRITIKFPQALKNINDKIEEVRALVQTETRLLPNDIRDFQVTQVADNKIFLANLGISGIQDQSLAHHDFIDSMVRQLKSVPGVAEVDSGLKPFHIFVKFDREKLAAKGVSVAQIRAAVKGELGANSISYNSLSGKSWLLEYTQEPVSLERIQNVQIRNNGSGQKLRISDVAEVLYQQTKNEKYDFLLDGERAVEVAIFKNEKHDSLKTFEAVKNVLDRIEKPNGVAVRILYDGPYFIKQQIDVLLSNGVTGLLLVMIILSLAMGWRTSLMTALGLPISYFGTFIILKLMGISIDLISLLAMILVVGNLVDDAVIFAERYNQLLAEGVEPKAASSQTAKEMIVPVSGTILTIIFAFIPIVVIDSELSVIFYSLPVVIASSLLLSWIETFFILPNHLQHYVKKPTAEKASVFFHWLANRYKVILRHTLRFRYLYGLGAFGLLVYSLVVATKMPQDFNISINAPQIELAITFKGENNFDKVIEVLRPLHAELKKLPANELDFIETNLGWVYRQGKSYRGSQYVTLRLVLDKHEVDIKSLRDKVQGQVNKILESYHPPEIAELVVIANERGANSRRTDLSTIQIKGKDEVEFKKAEADIINLVTEKNKSLEFAKPENEGPETFKFKINNQKISDYGLNRADLALQIQSLTGPFEILETRSKGRWMSVFLEPKHYEHPNLNDLNQLQIQPFDEGQKVKLNQFGQWISAGVAEKIEHKDGIRTLSLDFRYDGKVTNEQVVKKDLIDAIAPLGKKYPSLQINVVDANEQDKKGREWALKVILMAGVSIYLILAITLGSFSQPFIVGLPMPFALIGVIWALKLHGMQLGIMVMLGLIGTMGVSVNDSIVMVHQVNLLWAKFGVESAELIIEAAASRLRAMILITGCTLLGVFPTAYGVGGESGFTQPLAFSMGWGLSSSLLLTLFIIPSMLMVLKDVRSAVHSVKSKIKHARFWRPSSAQPEAQLSKESIRQIDLQN